MSRTLDTSALLETFAQGKEVNLPPDAQKRLEEMGKEKPEKKKNKQYSEENQELPLDVVGDNKTEEIPDSPIDTQLALDWHSIDSFLAHASCLFKKPVNRGMYLWMVGVKRKILDIASMRFHDGFVCSFAQGELERLTGTRPDQISRALKGLERDGFIFKHKVQRRRVFTINPEIFIFREKKQTFFPKRENLN